MSSLNVVTSSILKHYQESVLEKLIKDAFLEKNPKSLKIFPDDALSITMTEEVKLMKDASLHTNPKSVKIFASDPLSIRTTDDDPLSIRTTDDDPLSMRITEDDPLPIRMTKDDPLSIRMTKDDPLSIRMTEDLKLLSLNTSNLEQENTLTTDFIKGCPLIQNDELDGSQGQGGSRIKSRRMAVSERNEYDRYIFRVVFSNHVMANRVDETVLL